MSKKQKQEQKPWRLGGPDAPRWLQAPCVDAVKRNTKADLDLLIRMFDFRKLDTAHPLRVLWELSSQGEALAEARFEFHHLASDLRSIDGVQGATKLLNALRTDLEGYEDYRYELRIAGAVGRSPEQRLLAVAGKDKGPDIEVEARSGHRCGIACYRARSFPPPIQNAGIVTGDLVARLGQVTAAAPPQLGARIDMLAEFSRFPIPDSEIEEALATFAEVWNRPTLPEFTSGGVRVVRTALGPAFSPLLWEVGVLLRLPVPAREKHRLGNNIRDKLAKEERQWAKNYAGVPVLCVEESGFSTGIEKEIVEPNLITEAPHHFQTIITTMQCFGDAPHGARHRLEQISAHARATHGGLNLVMDTFGDNFDSWGDGHAIITFNPNHAEEEWRLCTGAPPLNVAGRCVRPLVLRRHFARLPVPIGTDVTAEQLKPILAKVMPDRKW